MTYYRVNRDKGEERLSRHPSMQCKIVWEDTKYGRIPFLQSYGTVICCVIRRYMYACCGSRWLTVTTRRHIREFEEELYERGIHVHSPVSSAAWHLFRLRTEDAWELMPFITPRDLGITWDH